MSLTTWHKDIKSWKNINQFLFKNETMSDCTFLVKVENTITKIPAHKYILGGYSPEFYNLFYLMRASSDEIPIDDISVNGLSSFLEFLYKETTELNMENIGDLLKLADRYSVESLKDFCGAFLLQNITVHNVLTVMDEYSIYELPKFEKECLKIISRKRLCFEDPSFLKISNQTLTTIIKSEELKGFTEMEVFEGTNRWAERLCNKMGQSVNSENKRLAVGPALQYIRFGAMTNTEFTKCSRFENSMLTPKEVIDIFQCFGSNGHSECQYSSVRRTSGIIKMLFHKAPVVNISTCFPYMLDYQILKFSVNKPIFVHGFQIYGRTKKNCSTQNPENFIITLIDQKSFNLIENIVEVQYDGSYRTYELLFNENILINANEQYSIHIKRQKPGGFRNYEVDEPSDNLDIGIDGGIRFNLTNRHAVCAGIIFTC